MKSVSERYGASPLHLLLVLCSFALTLYAGVRLLKGDTLGVVMWFVGAALLHDLVLLPLYNLTDRSAQRLLRTRQGTGIHHRSRRSWINYLRVPAFVSLLLLITWYPLILRKVPGYHLATALPPGVFLGRWLLITGALFAASALCLITAMWRGHAAPPPPPAQNEGPARRQEPSPPGPLLSTPPDGTSPQSHS
ncbi:hypothetical protein QMK19_31420 [Streptomyces sp. H10-C2]|uniref:hypothetical protein n=1 Tax=unclassified Streptomyces TaxID=2593676 RepID=UPI0024B8C4BA|nr:MULTISPECIES: hypothetical protein [unclassified Streptomyces]MDJ0346082.1 hypothetical protein [Streptomyces sp. PH10-H1]MDJ0374033.1 hypothetical protein [Streptomyces sp. H10-C2]